MATLIVLSGLPAVGKSTLARALAARTRAMWLRIDTMDQAIWASGTAPEDLRDWTYRAAQALAADNLALGQDVIADCVNPVKVARAGWSAAAAHTGARICLIEVVCSDGAEHRRRVETRPGEVEGLVLPSWAHVQDREWEPWDEPVVRLDTSGRTVAACVDELAAALAPGLA